MTSPFDGLAYGWRAFDHARFVVDPIDERVASIVGDWRATGGDAVALTDRDSYLLLAWSQRYALHALRSGSLDAAVLSLRGAALMRQSMMDFRDFSVDYPLYAVTALGGDVSRLLSDISVTAPVDSLYRQWH